MEQRAIQRQVARADEKPPPPQKGAMQAGARALSRAAFPEAAPDEAGHRGGARSAAHVCRRPSTRVPASCEDKVAIITGGDSGIGRAVAVLLVREGADVAVLHINEERDARDTKAAVMRLRGAAASPSPAMSVTCRFPIAAVEEAVARYGKLDMLVNNAAFKVHSAEFEDLTEEHFDMTLRTNLYGYFHMAQASVAYMKPGSAIVNTGSVTGCSATRTGRTILTTRAASMPSPARWRLIWCPAAWVNAVAPGAGVDARSTLPTRRPRRSRISAPTR